MKLTNESCDRLRKNGFYFIAALLSVTDRDDLPEFVKTFIKTSGFDPYNPESTENLSVEQREHISDFDHEVGKYMYERAISTGKINYSDRTATFQYTVGAILVFVSFIYIFLITWIPIPEQNIRFVDTALGFLLGTVISTIIMYFFGASATNAHLPTVKK